MVRNSKKIIFEGILDDMSAEDTRHASDSLASNVNDDIYACSLRIVVGVADKEGDVHYIDWMRIDQYRELWNKFITELFEMLSERPEIHDMRCSKYGFTDVNMNLDSDEDDEIIVPIDDVQQVFDSNRLYDNELRDSVFFFDVYIDADFRRTRQCVTLVKQLFDYFSKERAEETGSLFWVNSMCAGSFNSIGYNAFNMHDEYWGGKLASFCRGLIGMCETGEPGNTKVHCYADIENRYFKQNHRNDIVRRMQRFDPFDGVVTRIKKDVPLSEVKFSVVSLLSTKISNEMSYPGWCDYNSATDEIDNSDTFCKWSLEEARIKCMDAADQMKQSGRKCDAYIYKIKRNDTFGLFYINYDWTAIVDNEEYVVLLMGKYYSDVSDEDMDNACVTEMIDDMASIGIDKTEALKFISDAGINYFD